ncbi:uncharacterized protein LOC143028183 isoform X2 [Oratosquilla oratoria]
MLLKKIQGDVGTCLTVAAHNQSVVQSNTITLELQNYSIPRCNCVRLGYTAKSVLEAQNKSSGPLNQYGYPGPSTCSDFATQRGGGQKVVSYSYYNPKPFLDKKSLNFKRYLEPMYTKTKNFSELYPGWVMRLYHNISDDDPSGTAYLCQIFCSNPMVDLCHVERLPVLGNLTSLQPIGRTWRFAVLGDPTVSIILSRDSDSLIHAREVDAVNEWLKSGKTFHTMHDHPHHGALILAGLWGCRNKDKELMTSIRNKLLFSPPKYHKSYDQQLLGRILWPIMKNDLLNHNSYGCLLPNQRGSRPFPTKREKLLFVGDIVNHRSNHTAYLKVKCPVQCRPPDHQDWELC